MSAKAGRVAVLSDVHGNAVALQAVLAAVADADVELVVFGGDLTWGPLPAETLDLVRGLALPALYVRGNAERALLEPSDEPTERERWLAELHPPEALDFLRTFAHAVSVEVDGLGHVYCCHGSPRSDEELVTPETPEDRMRELSSGISERTLVTAHTHLQFDRHVVGIRSLNAGSVGMPYEGRPGAYWAILGPDVELLRTEYSLADAAAAYRATADPLAEEMVELLEQPPTRDEVIAHAESVRFAG